MQASMAPSLSHSNSQWHVSGPAAALCQKFERACPDSSALITFFVINLTSHNRSGIWALSHPAQTNSIPAQMTIRMIDVQTSKGLLAPFVGSAWQAYSGTSSGSVGYSNSSGTLGQS